MYTKYKVSFLKVQKLRLKLELYTEKTNVKEKVTRTLTLKQYCVYEGFHWWSMYTNYEVSIFKLTELSS